MPAKLDRAALAALERALAEVSSAPRAVVVRGERRAFCRGLDLHSLLRLSRPEREAAIHTFARCLMRLRRLPVPTLAVVDAPAVSGGVGLAAACDVVLATPTATFALPEVRLGLRHAIERPVIEERVRPARLRQLILKGSSVCAMAAVDIGLADRVVAPTSLRRVIHDEVTSLGLADPSLISAVKSTPGLATTIAAGAEDTLRRLSDPTIAETVAP